MNGFGCATFSHGKSANNVAQLLKDLDADEYKVRDKATKELVQMCCDDAVACCVEETLKKAKRDKNAEVETRCDWILESTAPYRLLVRELGAVEWKVRIVAKEEFGKCGFVALPYLEKAMEDADAERSAGAKECFLRIFKQRTYILLTQYVEQTHKWGEKVETLPRSLTYQNLDESEVKVVEARLELPAVDGYQHRWVVPGEEALYFTAASKGKVAMRALLFSTKIGQKRWVDLDDAWYEFVAYHSNKLIVEQSYDVGGMYLYFFDETGKAVKILELDNVDRSPAWFFNPKKNLAVCVGHNKGDKSGMRFKVTLINLERRRILAKCEDPEEIRAALFTPSDELILRSESGVLYLWEGKSDKKPTKIATKTPAKWLSDISKDGKRLLFTARLDDWHWKTVEWNFETQKERDIFETTDGAIWRANFTPDEKGIIFLLKAHDGDNCATLYQKVEYPSLKKEPPQFLFWREEGHFDVDISMLSSRWALIDGWGKGEDNSCPSNDLLLPHRESLYIFLVDMERNKLYQLIKRLLPMGSTVLLQPPVLVPNSKEGEEK